MPAKDYSFTGYKKSHRAISQQLRKSMTVYEQRLWYGFLKDYPVHFYRQRPVNRFVVDFYCSKARLVVELDGGQHFTQNGAISDSERTKILEQYGLAVLRFSNNDVENSFDNVCTAIHTAVQSRISE